MKISPKTYKLKKNQNYIKTNDFFFFFNGTNVKSIDWIRAEQKLKSYNFQYYKIFNKSISITLKKSIYSNIRSTMISSLIVLIKSELNNKNLNKKIVLTKLDFLNFILLSININNKVYSAVTIQEIISFKYVITQLVFYKFMCASLKNLNKKLLKSK